MSTSKLQRYISHQLSIHMGQYTIRENFWPDWLITPAGARLELDFYIEELGVAVEVQGEQHYRFVKHFHKTDRRWRRQLYHDRFKRASCISRGLTLVEVTSKDDFDIILSLGKKENIPEEEWLTQRWKFIERKTRWVRGAIRRSKSSSSKSYQMALFMEKSERLAEEFERKCPRPK